MPRSREAQARAWDRVLVATVVALLVVGLMAVYSATAGEPGSLWQKQIVYAAIGIVLVAGLQIVPPRVIYALAYPLYFLSLIPLLYIILFKGNSVERWIALPGGFNLQPSELTKIAFLLAMARFLSFKPVSLSAPRSLFMPFMLFIVPFILVLLQPNLSTALSFVAMTAMMAFFAGLTIRDLFFLASPLFSVILTFNNYAWAGLFIVLIAVMWRTRATLQSAAFWILANIGAGYAAIFVWNKILYAHQRGRILTFVDPAMDPQGAGYQVLQSKVVGEQIGFIGCLAVLGLFFLMLQRILGVAVDTRSRFTALVAVGITGIFTFHVLVNVSMTMGMMPVTGLPLPFLSYGGSFLISCLIMLGILFNLRAHGEYL
jgi:rod shape determining protein RodA